MNTSLRSLRTGAMLTFIAAIIGLLVYSRIKAYSLAPTTTPISLRGMEWWQIPVVYLIDYFSHAWICLLFAFTAAGLVYEFIPKEVIMRYMSSTRVVGYALALVVAPFFTVCSCTMVPLFAGVLYTGSGIGPAMTFLLMAPAANVLTILLTGEILGWEIALVRILLAMVTALVVGLVVSRTPWGKKIEAENTTRTPGVSADVIEKPPLGDRLWNALKFGSYLGKQILPAFLLGLVSVSYLTAYLPEEVVARYLTGFTGVLLASVIGGPLYTPTLVEIVLGKALMGLGMSPAATISWLMGQPYDIPNMVATSRVVKWKVVLTYAAIAWVFSVVGGLTYGLLIGRL